MSNTRELDDVFDELPPNVQQELQALEEIVYQQKQRIAELEAVNARLSAQVLRTQDKALELEQQLAELLEAVDMTILKHRIRKEKAGLVWFYMPSEEMEKLAALLQESSDE